MPTFFAFCDRHKLERRNAVRRLLKTVFSQLATSVLPGPIEP